MDGSREKENEGGETEMGPTFTGWSKRDDDSRCPVKRERKEKPTRNRIGAGQEMREKNRKKESEHGNGLKRRKRISMDTYLSFESKRESIYVPRERRR